MKLRKVEIAEGGDGGDTVTVTLLGDDQKVTSLTYTGKVTYGFSTREYGYANVDVTVTPFTQKQESSEHNNPTSKYT